MPDAVKPGTVPFAVWLMPEKKHAVLLSEIITQLCKTYSKTPFEPHLTLVSGLCSSIEQVISRLLEMRSTVHPLVLSIDKVDCSEEFFRTLFIQLRPSNDLEKLYSEVKG